MLRTNGGSTTEDVARMFLAYLDVYFKVVLFGYLYLYPGKKHGDTFGEREWSSLSLTARTFSD